jgi:two-component system nitrate/nitrite response regulator NarL
MFQELQMEPPMQPQQLHIAMRVTKTPIKIMLIAEQRVVRDALTTLFEIEPGFNVVGAVADQREAAASIVALAPDIVLVSVSGRMLHRVFKSLYVALGSSGPRTIVLATTAEKSYIAQANHLGASGILLKDTSPDVLYESVRSVAAGHSWFGRQQVADLPAVLESDSNHRRNAFGLTPRELEIIAAVGRGATNQQIATELAITRDTVKHHLSNIFTKTGVFTRLQLAVFAMHQSITVDANAAAVAVKTSTRSPRSAEVEACVRVSQSHRAAATAGIVAGGNFRVS